MIGILLLTVAGFAILNKKKPVVENTADAVTVTPDSGDPATTRNSGDNLIAQTDGNSEIPCLIMKDGKLIEVILHSDTPTNQVINDITQDPTGGISATSQNNDPFVQVRLGAGNETTGDSFNDAIATEKNQYIETADIISPMNNYSSTEIKTVLNAYLQNNDPNSLIRLSQLTGMNTQQLIDILRNPQPLGGM